MGKHNEITQEILLKAIENSQGIVSTIQAHLKQLIGHNVSWHTVDNAIKRYEKAQKAVQDEKEAVLDICENKVIKEILQGDVSTAKWYLKMKGRERGYEESANLNLGNGDPLNINLGGDFMNAEDNIKAGNVEMPTYDSTEEND